MKRGITLLIMMVCTLFTVQAVTYTTNKYSSQFKVNTIQNSSLYSNKSNNNFNISKPGSSKPRKVKGYTATGDSIDTKGKVGNPSNMWEERYSYYYYEGHWYRQDEDDNWEEWNSAWGWGLLGWDWYPDNNPGQGATQYFEENPMMPIEDSILWYILSGIYLYYKIGKRKRAQTLTL